ncbi:carcinoembryonic antigen-related cell adhesion molecule 3-like [Diceros bicornis minor]|uniref:carcinoembryonic antigen-related cell adhesion molecule 3-like n=1 Tax=Diceros bicornis minor TaxID=77932 RepID=UPI0026E95663|nr:carcinoembryonic antigen-related cell adhesion molecule 3-like [Diceros bicornis minor]
MEPESLVPQLTRNGGLSLQTCGHMGALTILKAYGYRELAQHRGRKDSGAEASGATALVSISRAHALVTEGGTEQAPDTMEPPSAPMRKEGIPWHVLLLPVSFLTIWNPPTTARLTVKSVPPNAVVGQDVLLLVSDLPQDLYSYVWCKGDGVCHKDIILSYVIETSENTSKYNGREKLYPNGSLLLQNITQEDTGSYTIEARKRNQQSDIGTVHLRVYHVPTQGSSGLSAGVIASIVIGVLAGIALIAAPVYFPYIRKTEGSGHSDNSPNKVDEVTYSSRTSMPRNQRNQLQPPHSHQPQEEFIQK